MKILKVAFVGLRHGHIVTLYERLKNDSRFKIVAVCEENAAAAEFAAKSWGISITHSVFSEMLFQVDFDILAVGDYYSIRGSRVIAALQKGKHILSDKPLCTSLEELNKIKSMATEKKLAIGLMLDLRLCAGMQAVKKLIDWGALGEIHAVNFGGQHPLNYGTRPGWYFEKGKHGGTINDIAIHGLDAVEFLTGEVISEFIAARTWNAFAVHEPDFQDSAQVMFALQNGCGCTADVSYAAPDKFGFTTPFYWRFTLWGSKGVAEFCAADDVVHFYNNITGKIENIHPDESVAGDYLNEFFNELNGNSFHYGTSHILHITEAALKLQRLSVDKKCHVPL